MIKQQNTKDNKQERQEAGACGCCPPLQPTIVADVKIRFNWKEGNSRSLYIRTKCHTCKFFLSP